MHAEQFTRSNAMLQYLVLRSRAGLTKPLSVTYEHACNTRGFICILIAFERKLIWCPHES